MSTLVPNTFQTPNLLVDRLLPLLTDSEVRVMLFMTRRILGFIHKGNRDRVSMKQIVDGTTDQHGNNLDYGAGVSRNTATKVMANLVTFGLLVVLDPYNVERNLATEYAIQLDDTRIDWDALYDRQTKVASTMNERMTQARSAIKPKPKDTPDLTNSTGPDLAASTPPDLANSTGPDLAASTPPIYLLEQPQSSQYDTIGNPVRNPVRNPGGNPGGNPGTSPPPLDPLLGFGSRTTITEKQKRARGFRPIVDDETGLTMEHRRAMVEILIDVHKLRPTIDAGNDEELHRLQTMAEDIYRMGVTELPVLQAIADAWTEKAKGEPWGPQFVRHTSAWLTTLKERNHEPDSDHNSTNNYRFTGEETPYERHQWPKAKFAAYQRWAYERDKRAEADVSPVQPGLDLPKQYDDDLDF